MLQYSSIGYAMQQTDEFVELQSVRETSVQNREEELNGILYEEEATHLTREINQTWKNWFVKTVIVEFPVIGDFFHDDVSILISIKRAGKSVSMLLGGSIGMMLDFIPMSENDDMAAKIAKDCVNMAIGMGIAINTYNTVLSLGYIGYNYMKWAVPFGILTFNPLVAKTPFAFLQK